MAAVTLTIPKMVLVAPTGIKPPEGGHGSIHGLRHTRRQREGYAALRIAKPRRRQTPEQFEAWKGTQRHLASPGPPCLSELTSLLETWLARRRSCVGKQDKFTPLALLRCESRYGR
jgi:hypothetical protein